MVNNKLKLNQWRVLKEMTREELASKSGVSYRTIQSYEKDVNNLRKAKYETLERIANALDISVDDIFLGHTSEKPKLKSS